MTTTLTGGRPEKVRDRAELVARHRVLSRDGDAVRVEVRVTVPGVGDQTAVVRLDRAAQLTAIETVEGVPVAALGDLGVSEIFPAAAGAPPDRRLRPGDRWDIDDRLQLDEMADPARLRGVGRLVSLAVVDGRDTATVRSTFSVPIEASISTQRGAGELRGTQRTELTVTYDLADGSVRAADATTTGSFRLVLNPPSDSAARPQIGTLTVEVTSETTLAD